MKKTKIIQLRIDENLYKKLPANNLSEYVRKLLEKHTLIPCPHCQGHGWIKKEK